jgi:hypothetical protein
MVVAECGINGITNISLMTVLVGLAIIIFPKKYLDIFMSRKDMFMDVLDSEVIWEAQSFNFSIVLKIIFVFFSGRYNKASFKNFTNFINDTTGFAREVNDIQSFAKWVISCAQPLTEYFGIGKQVMEMFGCSHPDVRFS